MKLRELATRLGCEVRGDGDVEIRRIAGIERAAEGDLTFLANAQYESHLAHTRASAVIVSPKVPAAIPSLLSANPYHTYARAAQLLHPAPRPPAGIDPSARVHPSARIAEGVHVGPLAVVGADVRIGARAVVHPHVVLYDGVMIGEDCILHSGVQVREGCRLGNRVIVQNNAVIGGDGFGFARGEDGGYEKIPQIGIVVIEDDVEIGALTAVDRASLHETRIGRGTKLDNLVQIGHSVTVGHDTVMASQVGIAGSTEIGSGVILAGQVGVIGHVKVGDGVIATGQTGLRNAEAGRMLSGSPAIDNRQWLKATAVFAKLPELQRRLSALEKKIEELLGR